MFVEQLPPTSKWGCDRITSYRTYIVRDGDFVLIKESTQRNMTLCNFNLHANLTLGVALVNSAQRESVRVLDTYVGSE